MLPALVYSNVLIFDTVFFIDGAHFFILRNVFSETASFIQVFDINLPILLEYVFANWID